jgi:hypothetical protein
MMFMSSVEAQQLSSQLIYPASAIRREGGITGRGIVAKYPGFIIPPVDKSLFWTFIYADRDSRQEDLCRANG